MACSYTRDEVAALILEVFRGEFDLADINEHTELGDEGLGADDIAKGSFYFPIRDRVETTGCRFRHFNSNSCRQAETVGEIIEAAYEDLRS